MTSAVVIHYLGLFFFVTTWIVWVLFPFGAMMWWCFKKLFETGTEEQPERHQVPLGDGDAPVIDTDKILVYKGSTQEEQVLVK